MALWNTNLLPTRRSERLLSPLADFDEMFDRLRKEFFAPELFRGSVEGFTPTIEVAEMDKNILVSAEIPGMNEKDINVTLKENNLIIEGEKKSGRKEEEQGYYCSEIRYGSFYRSIPLDYEVDSDNVKATYKNGVLEVTLSKLEESRQQAKRIEIKH